MSLWELPMRLFTAFLGMVMITLMLLVSEGCQFLKKSTPQNTPEAALQYFLSLDHEDIRKDAPVSDREGTSDALQNILRFQHILERQLIGLLKHGPDMQTLHRFNRVAEDEWDRRQTFLNSNHNLGLTANELGKAKSISRPSYVQRSVAQLTRKYGERSVIALAAIGSPAALASLSEVARNPTTDADMRRVIDSALEHYGRPPIRPRAPDGLDFIIR
jgi:hypothetical protein